MYKFKIIGDWGLGIGELGVGGWGCGGGDSAPLPNPNSPIPNPHIKNRFYLQYILFLKKIIKSFK